LIDNNAMGVVPDQRRVELNFLFRFLDSVDFYQFADKTSVPSIRKSTLARLVVPLPPLEEQRRIAAILDKADALRQKRRLAAQKLDSLTSSLFHEHFGKRASSNHNRVVPLANLAEVVSGVTKGRKLPANGVREVPYLRVANVQRGRLDLTELKTIPATPEEISQLRLVDGDILMTEGGDFDKLGRGGILRNPPEDCIHQNHIFRVRVDRNLLLPDFFHHYLQTATPLHYFLGCAKRTTNLASINMTQLRALPVQVPALEAQARFVHEAEKVEALANAYGDRLSRHESLFSSLQHRAFQGEL
jgi:type I restriction enzyme S subunit